MKTESAPMDCLKEWPEPVVRVQALAESGAATIPLRYVKPAPERPATAMPEPRQGVVVVAPDIPVINLEGLTGADPARCRATIRAVSEACREWGFFQVVNHGVSPEVAGKVVEAWRGFFRLPMDEKQKYANSPRTYEGYGSRLGVEKGAVLDWGDYYFLNLLPVCMRDDTKWPSAPTSCRETIEEYCREVSKVYVVLLKAMSLGLGLDAGGLQRALGGEEEDYVGACMRVNYYPKCPQPDLTLGLSSHSDPGALTILLPDYRVGGLQVRKGGQWVAVQPVPGAFIVNVSDQIQVLSNAAYKSVEHRVTASSEGERLSVAMFYNPRGDVPLGPIKALTAPPSRPPAYPSMTFNQYRLFVRVKGPRGKSQVDSLKAI